MRHKDARRLRCGAIRAKLGQRQNRWRKGGMGNFYTDTIMHDPRFNSLQPVSDMALLEPVLRGLVSQIMTDAAAAGIKLIAFETYRSQARQTKLFAQKATQ